MQRILRVTGWILVAIGAVGFIYSFPRLMELTVLHNLLHLGSGVLVIWAAGQRNLNTVITLLLAFSYLGLAFMGLISPYIWRSQLPLTPFDTFLHLSLAAIFLYAALFTGARARAR
jgi:hypothetical protein